MSGPNSKRTSKSRSRNAAPGEFIALPQDINLATLASGASVDYVLVTGTSTKSAFTVPDDATANGNQRAMKESNNSQIHSFDLEAERKAVRKRWENLSLTFFTDTGPSVRNLVIQARILANQSPFVASNA